MLHALCRRGDSFLRSDWNATKKTTNERKMFISRKLNSEQNYILFSDKKLFFEANGYSMLEEPNKFANDKSSSYLYLHMNKCSLSYGIDALAFNTKLWKTVKNNCFIWITLKNKSLKLIKQFWTKLYEFTTTER